MQEQEWKGCPHSHEWGIDGIYEGITVDEKRVPDWQMDELIHGRRLHSGPMERQCNKYRQKQGGEPVKPGSRPAGSQA